MTLTPYGLRVVGHRAGTRRLIIHAAAFCGYAECDSRADLERESFLTHFQFPSTFRDHFECEGSERGYSGPCGAEWIYWDIDRPDDLPAALSDTRRLCGTVLDRYRNLDEDHLLIFLSGGKGVHVGIPATWHPEPSTSFHAIAKRFCLELAESAGVVVDPAIYSKTRLFRAPNSRHPKTGLYKRRLSLDELTHLKPEAIVSLARHPEPFDIPTGPERCPQAADDWSRARRAVEQTACRWIKTDSERKTKLQALTLDLIREGAPDGEREVRVFRAAANLAEFGCPSELAHALLTDAALDSGLTPGEAHRAIDCGLAHVRQQNEEETS